MAVTWTDMPIVAGVTHIRKPHLDEIRSYINNHVNEARLDNDGGHPLATINSPGFMSASDKSLLQSVSATAGSIISIAGSGCIQTTGGTTPTIYITPATQSAAGSLTAADKLKLDEMVNIPARVSALEAKPGTGTVTSVSFTNPGVTITTPSTIPTITIPSASASGSGLMTSTQSVKLDTMDSFPIGSIIMWYGDSNAYNSLFNSQGEGLPEGRFANWKMLYGNSGAGSNGTPIDMRENFPLGADRPSNGTRAAGTDTFNLNGTESKGEQAHKLTTAELASHGHTFMNILASGGGSLMPQLGGLGVWGTQDTYKTGGDTAHNNMPPFVRLYFLYKYKI